MVGHKTQYQIRMKKAAKRKKARAKLVKKGLDPKEYYYGAYYIKIGS